MEKNRWSVCYAVMRMYIPMRRCQSFVELSIPYMGRHVQDRTPVLLLSFPLSPVTSTGIEDKTLAAMASVCWLNSLVVRFVARAPRAVLSAAEYRANGNCILRSTATCTQWNIISVGEWSLCFHETVQCQTKSVALHIVCSSRYRVSERRCRGPMG